MCLQAVGNTSCSVGKERDAPHVHVQTYGSGRVSSRVAVTLAVRPSWPPWKVLDERGLERRAPGVGERAVVCDCGQAASSPLSSPLSSGRAPRATFEVFPSLIRWIFPAFSSLFSTFAKVDSATPQAACSWPRST